MPKRTTAKVNPSLLRWARESAGLNLEEAAVKIKRPVAEVRAWEEGDSMPTVPQARKAAHVYRRPFAALFLPSVPVEPELPKDFRRMTADVPSDFSPELKLQIRHVRNKQRWAREWRRSRGLEPLEYVASWEGMRQPSRLAALIRKRLQVTTDLFAGMSREQAFNYWVDLVEQSGVFVMRGTGIDPAEARGFALPDPYAPFVFVNGDDSAGAKTFTLAHELAHIWIGSPSVSNPLGIGEYKHGAARIEAFCNRVASEVIVPPGELNQSIESDYNESSANELVNKIADRYKVSEESAARRLLDLGIVEQPFYERIRRKSKEQWKEYRAARKKRAKEKPPKIPYPRRVAASSGGAFLIDVISAFNNEHINAREVSRLLDADIKHLPELEAEAAHILDRRGR